MEFKFKDEKHKNSFNEQMSRCNVHPEDRERIALFYLLTLTDETRRHFDDIYDKDDESIKIECTRKPWLTSSSKACVRLAFNLFSFRTPTIYNFEDDEKENIISELEKYTPTELFQYSGYSEYFLEAIRIRFNIF